MTSTSQGGPNNEVKQPERPKLLEIMGPGLITGASDDDPSGIATYSQAGAQFGVNIIPHTQNVTTLGALKAGDETNFEVDMIARYIERQRSLS